MADIRVLRSDDIAEAVRQLFLRANTALPADMVEKIGEAKKKESTALAKTILLRLEENLTAARLRDIPICQDTGMAVVFVEVGNRVVIEGDTLEGAVNRGVALAYRDGGLRCSVVADPLFDRVNTNDNTPAVIHIRTCVGDTLRITAAPKGFGSENMASLRMFTPSATKADIVDYVVDAVCRAGANPCPPVTVGVGIGSDFEGVALLAKEALLRRMDSHHPDKRYADMEREILDRINALGIGPQGFGGDTTALAVHIKCAPTHIAGLPCAVNINCHANRHETVVL